MKDEHVRDEHVKDAAQDVAEDVLAPRRTDCHLSATEPTPGLPLGDT